MATTDNLQSLDRFLASVEARAYRIAEVSTRNADDALDIVQETMMKLVQKYPHKPKDEWPALFFTILNNTITDHHRKQSRLSSWQRFQSLFTNNHHRDEQDGIENDIIASAEDTSAQSPQDKLQQHNALSQLETAISQLPKGQQQAFLLRNWEGFSTKEAASMMKCSEGTVKTQYSRALINLQTALGDQWP